ncbi:MAG: MFS transporter [Chloroflexi bacterium]|nr:MFS transporter [Chloroflexota bacterium]
MAHPLTPTTAPPEPPTGGGQVLDHAEPDAAQQRGYEWVALSVTTVGALLAALQGSSLIIALPDVLTGLDATFLTIMWVLLGYLLITTALVPVVGRLADMWGRKRLYLAGFAIFTLGSLLAGLAQPGAHGWDLVAYRVVQGVGGALLITNSTAIVADAFRHGRVGLGLGVNQVAGAAGFLLGPVVGGLLTAISWRWVFLINVPIGIFGTLWGMWRLREPVRLPAHQRFDWLGSLTFVVGLGSLLMGLSLVAFPMLPSAVVNAMFVVAVIGLVAFLIVEFRTPEPMLDLRLFGDRLFGFASLAAGLNGLARGAVLFVLIFFLQGPYGQDPLHAGLMMTPFGAAFLLVGPLSGYLSDHYGSRTLATAGLLVSALGLFGLSTVVTATPYWELAAFMVLMGGGSGLFTSPNVNALMSTVPPRQRGTASGINTMVGNTGQMLSVAIAFPLVLSQIPEDVMFRVFLYGGGMSDMPEVQHAFEQGLHQAFLVSFGITLVAALASALRPAHSPREAAAQAQDAEATARAA